MFNAQVGKLALAIQDKNTLLSNSTRSNPYLQILERDIAVMKVACAESMKSTIETTELKLANTEQRMWSLNQEFMKLPRLEREFLTIQRKYKIINDLYDFLLKRKSEVEIQRAANTPDHEIVDFAGDTGISKISPGPKTAYINSMIWAILLPAVFLFMLVFFNNRVMALEDITSNTDIPVIGTLMRNPEKGVSSVLKSPNSYFTELLRIIRIKLNFNPANGEQVIMVTSAMEQEGKAFFALNFASVYALTGKKTIYLGFNLRRQRVPSDFDLDPGIGITDYLITDLHINTVIQKTFTKNLDILLSGPIPPNPDELIESEKTRLLFQELRKRYDYIVVETPPIGLVGDAYLLNRYSDATIFIVRYNFSTKKGFSDTLIEATHNEMKKIGIVYNDVRMKISSRDLSFYGEALKPKYRIMPLFIRIRRIIVDLLRKI
jgi:capsular exopolysaccharide synthesis family protein